MINSQSMEALQVYMFKKPENAEELEETIIAFCDQLSDVTDLHNEFKNVLMFASFYFTVTNGFNDQPIYLKRIEEFFENLADFEEAANEYLEN